MTLIDAENSGKINHISTNSHNDDSMIVAKATTGFEALYSAFIKDAGVNKQLFEVKLYQFINALYPLSSDLRQEIIAALIELDQSGIDKKLNNYTCQQTQDLSIEIIKETRQTAIVNHSITYLAPEEELNKLLDEGLNEEEALEHLKDGNQLSLVESSTELVDPITVHETSIII